MADATCWTLIEQAAAGGNAARAEFTVRYLPVVRAYLHARWRTRIGADDIEDAVQEVFLECLREGGVLERLRAGRKEGFRAFLFGVVRNLALRAESARARRLDAPQAEALRAELLPDQEESLSIVFERAWAESVVRAAAELQAIHARDGGPEQQKRVELLRLVFQENRSVAEVSRLWGVDERALQREYDRARSEYLRALQETVAFHHPGSPELVQRECRELVRLFG